MSSKIRLLVIAPNCDGTDVGEAFVAHRWVTHLAIAADVTLLTQKRAGRLPASEQLPGVEVIEWPELALPGRLERVAAMLKPSYPVFASKARRWIGDALASGRRFDIIHQLTPLALRYATPAQGFGIPYVVGPLGGSLETPSGFAGESSSAPLFTRLRAFDRYRLNSDPWLRGSYAQAACVIGVAPYVRDLMSTIPLRRFEVMSELGIDEPLPPMRRRPHDDGTLNLLHVARAVRTKGLRDSIRAMALLRDLPNVTLTQAGAGEELEICKAEAVRLGVADRVNFLGRVPRAEVETLYEKSDVFLFPSFREPSGSVIFEAMRHGLPVIAANRGGPGHVVNTACGIKVEPGDPEQFANAIAGAIRRLAGHPAMVAAMSFSARARAVELGGWSGKIAWMTDLYDTIIRENSMSGAARK